MTTNRPDGRRLLLAVLQRTEVQYVAARCRVTRSAVSRWASGDTLPSARARVALLASYQIPPDSWRQRARVDVADLRARSGMRPA